MGARPIILAAGLGRRMQPLSNVQHKTLLPIAGQPLLGRILDALLDNGISEAVVVTGYRSDEVCKYVEQSFPQFEVQWVHNPDYETTNNIRSLALAFDAISSDCDILLIECDLVFEARALRRLLASPHPNVALLDRFRPGMDGTVVAVANGTITQVIPPHLQTERFDYSDKYKTLNIYRFSQELYQRIFRRLVQYYAQTVDSTCYYEAVLGILIYMHHAEVHAEILDGERWAEIDDPIDLSVAEFEFDPARRREILEKSHGGYWKYGILDFAYIRNCYFPTPDIVSDMRTQLANLIGEYGSSQRVLDEKLSYLLDCRKEQVVLLNGCSQVFPWLRQLANGQVLIPQPTFGEFDRTFPTAHTYEDAVGVALEALEKRIPDYDTVVIVNPNNPTGTTLPSARIHEWLMRYPGTRFVVDESFLDFSEETSLVGADAPANLLVIKSLSKSLGAPGLRLGYAFSTDLALLASLRQILPIWNINALAEYFLDTLFKHRSELSDSWRRLRGERAALAAELEAIDGVLRVYPSGASFLLARLSAEIFPAADTVEALLAGPRIFIKDVSGRFPGNDTWLRLAVRLAEENRFLTQQLRLAARKEST